MTSYSQQALDQLERGQLDQFKKGLCRVRYAMMTTIRFIVSLRNCIRWVS